MSELRPLRVDEWDPFLVRALDFYVSDMVAAGVDRAVARAKAEQDFPTILPAGIDTKDHLFFVVEEDGEDAGYLWLADRKGELGHNLFVYAIEIYEPYRGRGLARHAMQFAEEEARRRGIPKVALNVFGGNDGARRLYLSLGYTETAIHMEKPV